MHLIVFSLSREISCPHDQIKISFFVSAAQPFRAIFKHFKSVLTFVCFLRQQVKNERAKLLAHPLVTCLLRSKWTLCGRYVYYSKLVLYVVFLMFLTAYSMVTIREQHKRECYVVAGNATQCSCVAPSVRTSVSRKFWVDFGKYMVVILASISLFTEVRIF